ncbi:MAG: ribulose-phosphate 3-epimerase [bacterium]
MRARLAPSILSADFARLGDEVRMVEEAGADLLHLDVMDAHFVPNLTFGPLVVGAVRRLTDLFLDTHLMITHPDTYLESFIQAGADRIHFHLEPFSEQEGEERAREVLSMLERAGVERGIAVNPETPIDTVFPWLDRLEAVLVMTVHPGFGGQSLIRECLDKIPLLRAGAEQRGVEVTIGVDGGVTRENAAEVAGLGADMLVAGSAVFRAADPAGAVRELKDLIG